MQRGTLMKLGIIGAMEEEIILLQNELGAEFAKTKAGKKFYKGKFKGIEIFLTESGIGKVNAAVATQILIDDFGVEKIICTGVAGAVNRELDVKDVVISIDVVQHDIDVSKYGYPKGFIPRLGIREFQADKELVKIAKEAGNKILKNNRVHNGRILTGDQFIADRKTVEELWKEFKGYCVEMEGGAIAQTCFLNKIPFVIIRAISDRADSSAHIDYKSFVHDAAKNSFLIVINMLARIAQI